MSKEIIQEDFAGDFWLEARFMPETKITYLPGRSNSDAREDASSDSFNTFLLGDEPLVDLPEFVDKLQDDGEKNFINPIESEVRVYDEEDLEFFLNNTVAVLGIGKSAILGVAKDKRKLDAIRNIYSIEFDGFKLLGQTDIKGNSTEMMRRNKKCYIGRDFLRQGDKKLPPNQYVSFNHLAMDVATEFDPPIWRITDLASTNGTKILAPHTEI